MILTWSFPISVLALSSAFSMITYHQIAVSKPGCSLVNQFPLHLLQWYISRIHKKYYYCISHLEDQSEVDHKFKKQQITGLHTDSQHIEYKPLNCFVGQWQTASLVPDCQLMLLSVQLVLQLVSDDHLYPHEELNMISIPRLAAELERHTFKAHVSMRWELEVSEWLLEFLL